MLRTQSQDTAPRGLTVAEAREPGPDAELLALWARFLALMTAGRDLHDEAFDPISREMTVIEHRLETMTAATPSGVAVLLRVSCLRGSYGDALQDRYVGGPAGDDPPPALDPMLWRALISIERQTSIANSGRETERPCEATLTLTGTD